MKTYEINCGNGITDVIDLGDDHPFIKTFDNMIAFQEKVQDALDTARVERDSYRGELALVKLELAQLRAGLASRERYIEMLKRAVPAYYWPVDERNSGGGG